MSTCVEENALAVPEVSGTHFGSTASFKDATKIENVLDWRSVVKKYYAVVKNSPDK